MAPMTGKKAWWGAGIPLAIEMAFEDINARNDILKEYRLQLVARDTQVRYRTCLFKQMDSAISTRQITIQWISSREINKRYPLGRD